MCVCVCVCVCERERRTERETERAKGEGGGGTPALLCGHIGIVASGNIADHRLTKWKRRMSEGFCRQQSTGEQGTAESQPGQNMRREMEARWVWNHGDAAEMAGEKRSSRVGGAGNVHKGQGGGLTCEWKTSTRPTDSPQEKEGRQGGERDVRQLNPRRGLERERGRGWGPDNSTEVRPLRWGIVALWRGDRGRAGRWVSTHLEEGDDHPCHVNLPPLQAVPGTELEGVVVVVPALAEGQDADPPVVAAQIPYKQGQGRRGE